MNFEKLKEYLDSLESEFGIHGVDCKVTKGNETVFRHMAGHSDYDGKVGVSDNDLYYIYSATKVITMVSVMQLVEQGKIALEDEVSKYLPEYSQMDVVEDFAVGEWPFEWPKPEDKTHKAKNTIRIIDLMTMTSGLSYDTESYAIEELKRKTNNKATTRETVAAIAEMPLICEPRTRWAYNLGHDVLAGVVEVVSGEKYGDHLRKHIFEPLGIKEMYFHLNDAQKARLSAQYVSDFETKEIVPVENTNRFKLTENYESGGAGLACTVDAYSTFIQAISNNGVGVNGNRIISKESIDRIRENFLHGQMLEDFMKSGKKGYGYGLGVRTLIDNSESKSPIGEFGWDGAAGAYVLIDPINNISIYYAQQVLGCLSAYYTIHPKIRDLTYEALGI
ncbi:MAG: serine hydrolase domain-containing protein [Eubacteriales bacterium]